jgi:MFS family permease
VSLALAAGGMFLSATAHSAGELGLWRAVTGLGVGGILACTNVIASEYSSDRRRGLCIGIYTAGYGVGATLGGMAAVALQGSYGWRSVFIFGSTATALALALLAVLLPESVDFLLAKRPRNVVERLNKIARRLGQPAVGELAATPAAGAGAPGRNRVGELLAPEQRRTTLLIWLAFFATMFGFYFVNSWTPRLLVEAGMTEQQGVVGGLMLTLGGTFGSILYGVLAGKWSSRAVFIVFAVLSAASMVLFISTAAMLALAFVTGVAVGMLINGCIAGLYTITPSLYATRTRSTGVGWAIGIGRAGAIVAPMITGALLDAAWSPVQLYLGVGAVVLVAAVAVRMLGPARSRVQPEREKVPAL